MRVWIIRRWPRYGWHLVYWLSNIDQPRRAFRHYRQRYPWVVAERVKPPPPRIKYEDRPEDHRGRKLCVPGDEVRRCDCRAGNGECHCSDSDCDWEPEPIWCGCGRSPGY